MPLASPLGEAVYAALRTLKVDAQAVLLRVDATMLQFDVYAQLVANNTDFLRRLHLTQSVIFSDGPTGDDGLVMGGLYKLPDESVVFTDGPNGDNGLWLYIPITVDGADETVVFSEIDHTQNWAIHDTEFASFLESSLHYVIDVASFEQFTFKDISVGWFGKLRWNEQVVVNDSMFVLGGNNDLYLRETVNISETVTNDASFDFHFGDAVTMFEVWVNNFAVARIDESVTVIDKVVVSKVAATDSRPGAFVPGAALLGSPS